MAYGSPVFKRLFNSSYFPVTTMVRTVKRLRQSKGADFIKNIKFGDFETLVQPAIDLWPMPAVKKMEAWSKAVASARADLAAQPNFQRLSDDDPRVPTTKCELLDLAVQKCFSECAPGQKEPGIPMYSDVREKAKNQPDSDRHDITIVWTYSRNGRPIQMNVVMTCPAGSGDAFETMLRAGGIT